MDHSSTKRHSFRVTRSLPVNSGPRVNRIVLVLTHAPWETPGLIDVALEGLVGAPQHATNEGDLRVQRRTILREPNPDVPSVDQLAGLIVMGGPQDANDDRQYPGLVAERRLLAEAASSGVPVLGVCLGMQLLALSLGAKLHLRHGREIGIAPLTYTAAAEADSVLGPIARSRTSDGAVTQVVHWHSDAVELPPGGTLLASTPRTPVQAFRCGSALGLQFHVEVDTPLLDVWLREPTMVHGLSPDYVEEIRANGAQHLPNLRRAALLGLQAFISSINERL